MRDPSRQRRKSAFGAPMIGAIRSRQPAVGSIFRMGRCTAGSAGSAGPDPNKGGRPIGNHRPPRRCPGLCTTSPIASPKSGKSSQKQVKPVQAALPAPIAEVVVLQRENPHLVGSVQTWAPVKMAEREGFEPSAPAPPSLDNTATCKSEEVQSSPIASPNLGNESLDLEKIVRVWPSLRRELKAAIKAIVESAE
jgi:hypothetical protein